jgi:prevent-host-death family protein
MNADRVMQISVTGAEERLTDVVRRTEAGDEIILTRHGNAAVRLVPVKPGANAKSRKALLDTARASVAAMASAGPSAARSQDSSTVRMVCLDDHGCSLDGLLKPDPSTATDIRAGHSVARLPRSVV